MEYTHYSKVVLS